MLGNDMDIIAVKQMVLKRGFQILILIGLFVVLLQPKIKVESPKETDSKPRVNYFQDINLGMPDEKNPLMNTSVQDLSNIDITVGGKDTREYTERKKLAELLTYNKKLIMLECVRIEPKLSQWYWLSSAENSEYPSFEFILNDLETKLGAEKLYGNVSNGIEIIFDYLKKYEKGSK